MAIIAMLLAFFLVPQGFMAKQMNKMKYKYLWTWRNKPQTIETAQMLGQNCGVNKKAVWTSPPPELWHYIS